jgi:hypothetical protein
MTAKIIVRLTYGYYWPSNWRELTPRDWLQWWRECRNDRPWHSWWRLLWYRYVLRRPLNSPEAQAEIDRYSRLMEEVIEEIIRDRDREV